MKLGPYLWPFLTFNLLRKNSKLVDYYKQNKTINRILTKQMNTGGREIQDAKCFLFKWFTNQCTFGFQSLNVFQLAGFHHRSIKNESSRVQLICAVLSITYRISFPCIFKSILLLCYCNFVVPGVPEAVLWCWRFDMSNLPQPPWQSIVEEEKWLPPRVT